MPSVAAAASEVALPLLPLHCQQERRRRHRLAAAAPLPAALWAPRCAVVVGGSPRWATWAVASGGSTRQHTQPGERL